MITIDTSQITLGYILVETNPTIWLLGLGFYAGVIEVTL